MSAHFTRVSSATGHGPFTMDILGAATVNALCDNGIGEAGVRSCTTRSASSFVVANNNIRLRERPRVLARHLHVVVLLERFIFIFGKGNWAVRCRGEVDSRGDCMNVLGVIHTVAGASSRTTRSNAASLLIVTMINNPHPQHAWLQLRVHLRKMVLDPNCDCALRGARNLHITGVRFTIGWSPSPRPLAINVQVCGSWCIYNTEAAKARHVVSGPIVLPPAMVLGEGSSFGQEPH
ncbi:hypothetical protein C8R45DRAFT_942721 [Mycena sanguinolenta]|nr:hypothetical protein C8R45DRAFT_942721 [Mycena sanguinolenta]